VLFWLLDDAGDEETESGARGPRRGSSQEAEATEEKEEAGPKWTAEVSIISVFLQ